MQETWGRFLGREDPLEKGLATCKGQGESPVYWVGLVLERQKISLFLSLVSPQQIAQEVSEHDCVVGGQAGAGGDSSEHGVCCLHPAMASGLIEP